MPRTTAEGPTWEGTPSSNTIKTRIFSNNEPTDVDGREIDCTAPQPSSLILTLRRRYGRAVLEEGEEDEEAEEQDEEEE